MDQSKSQKQNGFQIVSRFRMERCKLTAHRDTRMLYLLKHHSSLLKHHDEICKIYGNLMSQLLDTLIQSLWFVTMFVS